MKAAIYARVSTEEQTKNFSIENQLDNLRKYCQQRDYQIAGEYVDPGWSGTILDRPALTKLLADAKAKLFDTVVVYKLDRLCRNSRHMYNTLAELEAVGIGLASVTEPFDTTTTMGKAYLGMASTFAEWERNTFMERSMDGTRKAIEKGQYPGGNVSYGYRSNRITKKLEIDEEEAKLVKDMFRWLISEGMSTCDIARRLNALGIPTRGVKECNSIKRKKAVAGVWVPAVVYSILKNIIYTGEWHYGKRGKKHQIIVTKCSAVIDSDTFQKAQARLKQNSLWSERNTKREYLLRGLMKCGSCGHGYVGTFSYSGRKYDEIRYYKCIKRIKRGSLFGENCDSASVRADAVESFIWQDICNFIQNREVIESAFKEKFDICKQATNLVELTQFKCRLNQLKIAEQKLLVKYADPTKNFSEEALNGAVVDIKKDTETIQSRINELESTIANEKIQARKLNEAQFILDKLADKIPNASFEVKRKVIEQLVKEITIGKTEDNQTLVTVKYWFGKELIQQDSNTRLRFSRMAPNKIRFPFTGSHIASPPDVSPL